jgi:hypothetical protein
VQRCCDFIVLLARLLRDRKPLPWLNILADAATEYTTAQGVQRKQLSQLLGLGMRRCDSFLSQRDCAPPGLFGLEYFCKLQEITPSIEKKIKIMRTLIRSSEYSNTDFIIRYRAPSRIKGNKYDVYEYASVFPYQRTSSKRSHDGVPVMASSHGRWVTGKLKAAYEGEYTLSCGESCEYNNPSGPECICLQAGFPCTEACHDAFPAKCQYELPGWPSKCIQGCAGEGACPACYNNIVQSMIEGQGEQCFLLRPGDVFGVV